MFLLKFDFGVIANLLTFINYMNFSRIKNKYEIILPDNKITKKKKTYKSLF